MEEDDDFAKGDLVEIQTRDGTTRLCYVRRVNKLTLQLECMSTGEEYRAGKAVCKLIQKAISSEKKSAGMGRHRGGHGYRPGNPMDFSVAT